MKDNTSISFKTLFTDDGVAQVTDICGELSTRFVNLREAALDKAIQQKLMAMGWTPPDAAQLGHVHGVVDWVDCKDRLPTTQQPVLVTMETTVAAGETSPGHRFVSASYYNGTGFDCEPRFGGEIATHWAEWPVPAADPRRG